MHGTKFDSEPGRRRFEALDGIRGLAAITVLLYHTALYASGPPILGHGYLAVDVFFILSGFVIAAAYERKLAEGLHPFRFMAEVRLVRLYPLAFLGLVLGALASPFAEHAPSLNIKGVVQQALFVPAFNGRGTLYPYNNIQWSLAFELLANIVHVLFLRRLRTKGLVISTAALLALLAVAAWRFGGLDAGSGITNMWAGAARALFSYTAGVLAFRLYKSGRLTGPSLSPWVAACGFLIVVALAAPHGPVNALRDLVVVAALIPAVLIVALNTKLSPALAKASRFLGEVSYPIYAIQQAMFFLLLRPMRHLHGAEAVAVWLLVDIATCAAAWVVLKMYDEPIRRRLTTLLRLRAATPANTAP